MTGFDSLGVRPELVAVLQRHGIAEPFPIQRLTVPDALAGRDVLGRGRTGSGKTVAFALPVVTRLLEAGRRPRARRPRALVLVPTRELAVQVNQTMAFLARAVGLRTMTVYGGVAYGPQLRRLEEGVDILIATAGRLEDLIEKGACDLSDVRITVLDEADLMADMGFLPAVMRLLRQTAAGGQRMLFSATLDRDVKAVVDAHLSDPVEHSVAAEAAPDIEHRVFLVTRETKAAVLADLVSGHGRTLVFARTKHGATRLAKALTRAGIPAGELHGDLRQSARQSNLDAFASGRTRVLVATDVAARGIHVDDIALVVHADPPNDPKAFLHRSGRTARAGASGVVVTLCQRDQNKAVKALMAAAKINPLRELVEPGSDVIAQVRGPVAPLVAPAPPHVPVKQPGKQRPRSFEVEHTRPAGRRPAKRWPAGTTAQPTSARPRTGDANSRGAEQPRGKAAAWGRELRPTTRSRRAR